MVRKIFAVAQKSVLIGSLALLLGGPACADKLTVAVFTFEARDSVTAGLEGKITDLLTAELSRTGNFRLVEREQIDYFLSVLGLGIAEIAEENQTLKVGSLANARVLILGRIFALDQDLVVISKIIGTETSRLEAVVVRAPLSPELEPVAEELCRKITRTILEKSAELTAPPEPEKDLILEITQKIKDKRLPKVAVQISENCFEETEAATAEIEFISILSQCGFSVVEEEEDVLITGQAVGEYGVRRGNLVSGKARLEVKTLDTNTREVLTADRQTGVAVDVSEQIAVRTALQETAADVAGRIIPEMVEKWNESR